MDPYSTVLFQKVKGPPGREILWGYANTNSHYRIYSAPSFVHILSQINPIHTLPHYFFNIYLALSNHLSSDLKCCPPKSCTQYRFSPNVQQVLLIPSSFIWPPKRHSVTSSLQRITQYSPVSSYFRPLRSKFRPQNSLLEHHQPIAKISIPRILFTAIISLMFQLNAQIQFNIHTYIIIIIIIIIIYQISPTCFSASDKIYPWGRCSMRRNM